VTDDRTPSGQAGDEPARAGRVEEVWTFAGRRESDGMRYYASQDGHGQERYYAKVPANTVGGKYAVLVTRDGERVSVYPEARPARTETHRDPHRAHPCLRNPGVRHHPPRRHRRGHRVRPGRLAILPSHRRRGRLVQQPQDAFEYRLGTVTDIGYAPDGTNVERYRLRFPTGEERTYPVIEVIACSRTDDHAALVAAFTDTCRSLRDACRIAHDFGERLSGDIIGLLLAGLRHCQYPARCRLRPEVAGRPGDSGGGWRPAMKSGYWHAKAVHHAGPVCGADDGPITRVTGSSNFCGLSS
jgi:hypothetical protein